MAFVIFLSLNMLSNKLNNFHFGCNFSFLLPNYFLSRSETYWGFICQCWLKNMRISYFLSPYCYSWNVFMKSTNSSVLMWVFIAVENFVAEKQDISREYSAVFIIYYRKKQNIFFTYMIVNQIFFATMYFSIPLSTNI